HPSHAPARRRAGRLRSLRHPRAGRGRVTPCAPAFRVARSPRSHVDPALHRDALRPARADGARCERGSDARVLRLRASALPQAAALAEGADLSETARAVWAVARIVSRPSFAQQALLDEHEAAKIPPPPILSLHVLVQGDDEAVVLQVEGDRYPGFVA